MEEKFCKDFCMGCKRIIAQVPIKAGKPINPVMCKRCLEEAHEIMKAYESAYGYKPYWVTTKEEQNAQIN